MHRSLSDDMAHAVTEQNLHRNLWIFFLSVGNVDQSAGDAVCHFVRVRRIYFFKHIYIPFRERSRRSITSSCGVAPVNSAEQFSFTIWNIWYHRLLTCFI